MVFKADRTKLIWFSLRKPDVKEQPKLDFEDEDVSFIFELVKDLGILFVSTLSCLPSPHTDKRIYDAYDRFNNLKESPEAYLKSTKRCCLPNLLSTFPNVWLPNLVP